MSCLDVRDLQGFFFCPAPAMFLKDESFSVGIVVLLPVQFCSNLTMGEGQLRWNPPLGMPALLLALPEIVQRFARAFLSLHTREMYRRRRANRIMDALLEIDAGMRSEGASAASGWVGGICMVGCAQCACAVCV